MHRAARFAESKGKMQPTISPHPSTRRTNPGMCVRLNSWAALGITNSTDFDQNHNAQRPLQNGESKFCVRRTHASPYVVYLSAARLRGALALISFSRWLALESRSNS